MFKKEAKEYEERKHYRYEDNDYCGDIADGIIQAYQQGAEFGYNKAKEEIEKLRELVSDCLFYCDHIDPYYNECLTEDNIFERAKKLGIDEE